MSAYLVHVALPRGVPVPPSMRVRVGLEAIDAQGVGRLVLSGAMPELVQAVRARLQRSYGLRGAPLGTQLTQDDLHCAVRCAAMTDLVCQWCGPERPKHFVFTEEPGRPR